MMQSIVSYPSLLRTVGLSGAGFSPRLVTDPTSFSDAENSLQIGSFGRNKIKDTSWKPEDPETPTREMQRNRLVCSAR